MKDKTSEEVVLFRMEGMKEEIVMPAKVAILIKKKIPEVEITSKEKILEDFYKNFIVLDFSKPGGLMKSFEEAIKKWNS